MTDDQELTIDELAAASRVPSRTIRFYQSRGALMHPEIRGRVAYYGKQHVERLKLIAQLQDRGLRIDAIGDLMKRIDRGEVDLAEWLGVEEQVQAPWALDQARTVTEAELYDIAGTRRPGLLADLTRARIVERKGDVYFLASPALLAIALKLENVGIDLEIRVRIGPLIGGDLAVQGDRSRVVEHRERMVRHGRRGDQRGGQRQQGQRHGFHFVLPRGAVGAPLCRNQSTAPTALSKRRLGYSVGRKSGTER